MIDQRAADELSARLSGIVPPLVTPLQDVDRLDVDGLGALIEHVLSGGVSGVFILGTTGEAPSLSYRLRRETIQRVVQFVGGRVPVLVGVTDTSFVETQELSTFAADAGATGLVLSTPYYFPAGQTELRGYVGRVVQSTPLPLMLYNMPSLTKVWFEVETLRQLAEHAAIIGVKDSSADMRYFGQLLQLRQARDDWRFLVGPEHLLPQAMQMGADGGVHGGANCVPSLFTGLYDALSQARVAEVESRMQCVNKLQEIYQVGKYASRFIKATKCALSIMGICSDRLAEPFHHFHAPERQRVQQLLRELSAIDSADHCALGDL